MVITGSNQLVRGISRQHCLCRSVTKPARWPVLVPESTRDWRGCGENDVDPQKLFQSSKPGLLLAILIFFFFFLCSLLDCRGGIYSEPVSEAHEHPSIEFRAKAKGGQWSVVTESSADVWSPPEVLVPSQRPPSNRNDPARRSNNQYTCTG